MSSLVGTAGGVDGRDLGIVLAVMRRAEWAVSIRARSSTDE